MQGEGRKNPALQRGINDINIFKADLSKWIAHQTIAQIVHLIVCLTLVALSVVFLLVGIIKRAKITQIKVNKN